MEAILVGVDGSEHAGAALGWAADLAVRSGAELVAARVFTPDQAELRPDIDDALRAEQRHELETWVAALPPGVRAHAALLDGDPPDALLAAAGDHHAGLLVVGGRGTGGFLRLHLGSVAHHLTHHTTLPLAIVPETGAAPVEHLVVGVDGSPGSRAAVDVAASLAASLGLDVTAVYAYEPFVEWLPESHPGSWRRDAETEVRQRAAAIERAGAPLDVVIDRDIHPVAAIARVLDARPGSVAVVGTRGLGGFTGLRLGRVPLQLVHHTGAAVLLVPPEPSVHEG